MHRPNKTAAVVVLAAALVIALPASGLSLEPTPAGAWQHLVQQVEKWLGWSEAAPAESDAAVRNTSAAGGVRWDPDGLTASNDGDSEESAPAPPATTEGGGVVDQADTSGSGAGGSQ